MQKKITLADFFIKNASKDKFVLEIETGKKKNYIKILEAAKKISSYKKINKGDIVTVILPNSIDFIECFLASLLGGWIFNPLPYFIQDQEIEKIFDYVRPKLIITNKKKIFEKFCNNYKIISPKEIILTKKVYTFRKINPNHPAALYYSSGTTGNPKGVLYSHDNMTSLIRSIVKGFKFKKKDNQLAFLPFGHTASINYNILPSLLIGCNLFISKGFEHLRSNFFNVLEEYKITYTEVVPSVLFLLNKLKVDIRKLDLSSLEFIGCGSSTLPISAQKEFIRRYKIGIGNLYGLSETGPSHIDDPRKKNWKPGSIGVPLDVNKCKINKHGEMLIKGKNVFIGYYKNKKLYEKVVKNHWFCTGDLGKHHRGKFYFVDRKKDLIIKSGINIVPMEIEEVVHKHPNILECVVIGKTDKIHGEEIALVAVKSGKIKNKTLREEIIRLCGQNFSSYKVPNHIEFWNSIPKTPSKKLLRRKVREIINKT